MELFEIGVKRAYERLLRGADGENCTDSKYGTHKTHTSTLGLWLFWKLQLYSSLVTKKKREIKKAK